MRQREPQHRARLHVFGQGLLGRAVDQGIDIAHPAQGFGRDGDGEAAVGGRQALRRGVRRDVERVAAPQDGIEQA